MNFIMKTLLPRLWRRSRRQELSGRAAQIAYFLLFATFPAILLMVGVLSQISVWDISNPSESLLAMGLPIKIAEPLAQEAQRIANPAASSVLFSSVLGFYLAARAVDSICGGVNAAWGLRDPRPWSQRKVRVLLITAASIAGTALSVLLLSIEPVIRAWFDKDGLTFGDTRLVWLRWPILLFVLHSLIWLVYRLGAERRVGRGWITWGTSTAAVGVVVVSYLFGFYIQNIADLGATYGSLGSAMGLAAYCYLASYMVLLGAALDCELKQLGYG